MTITLQPIYGCIDGFGHIEVQLLRNSGVDPEGGGQGAIPPIKIPGLECLFVPSVFQPFCSNLRTVGLRHFRSEFWGLKLHQTLNFPWLRPGPRWGSLQRSLRPLAGGEGANPLPKNPTSALGPSVLGLITWALRASGEASSLSLSWKKIAPSN